MNPAKRKENEMTPAEEVIQRLRQAQLVINGAPFVPYPGNGYGKTYVEYMRRFNGRVHW